MLAGFIDYGIIFLFTGLIFYFFGESKNERGFFIGWLPVFGVMLFWFFFTVGLEHLVGATIGNILQNLKPVPKADPRVYLTFSQSFKRHLLDLVDLWLFGLLGIILIKNTKYHQRLGDLWAKTIVLDETDPEQGINFN